MKTKSCMVENMRKVVVICFMFGIHLVGAEGLAEENASSTRGQNDLADQVREYYKAGARSDLLKLVYGHPNVAYRETLEWMLTNGAGELEIQYLVIRNSNQKPPPGFDSVEATMEGVEFNLPFNNILYLHAAKEGVEWRLAWPLAQHGHRWWLVGLREQKPQRAGPQ